MRLNKSTGHAIRILIECARGGDNLIKVADLSDRLGITMQNAFKIVHLLSRAGLVAASRGRNGGVPLARPAERILVGDIVRAMEETAVEVETSDLSRSREKAVSGVNRVLDDALEAFISVLDKHSLADMTGKDRTAGATPQKRRARATSSAKTMLRNPRN
ncbi:MAG: RrF2 family transcriptional regulator [Hyphomicrobiaceae bacterium]